MLGRQVFGHLKCTDLVNYKGTASLVMINNKYSKETTLKEKYRLVAKVERTRG